MRSPGLSEQKVSMVCWAGKSKGLDGQVFRERQEMEE